MLRRGSRAAGPSSAYPGPRRRRKESACRRLASSGTTCRCTGSFLSDSPLADLELAPLNPDLGQYFGATEGVLVISVRRTASWVSRAATWSSRWTAGSRRALPPAADLAQLRSRRNLQAGHPAEPEAGDGHRPSRRAGQVQFTRCAPAHRCLQGSSVYLRPTLEETMGFLWTLIIGLVVGAIAKLLMPGRDPGGYHRHHADRRRRRLLAGFLGRALGWYAIRVRGPESSPRSSARCSAPPLPAVRRAARHDGTVAAPGLSRERAVGAGLRPPFCDLSGKKSVSGDEERKRGLGEVGPSLAGFSCFPAHALPSPLTLFFPRLRPRRSLPAEFVLDVPASPTRRTSAGPDSAPHRSSPGWGPGAPRRLGRTPPPPAPRDSAA